MKRKKQLSCCGVIVFIEKEAVQLLVLQKWVSCFHVGLSDRVKISDLFKLCFFM